MAKANGSNPQGVRRKTSLTSGWFHTQNHQPLFWPHWYAFFDPKVKKEVLRSRPGRSARAGRSALSFVPHLFTRLLIGRLKGSPPLVNKPNWPASQHPPVLRCELGHLFCLVSLTLEIQKHDKTTSFGGVLRSYPWETPSTHG